MKIISPDDVNAFCKSKGWRHRDDGVTTAEHMPELLLLMHSELSEATEGYRAGKLYSGKGCVAEELADCVIRIWHFCALYGIDIASEVNAKHQYNLTREHRHGNKKI